MDLFFDREFRDLIPPPSRVEHDKLEEDLKAHGNLDPIIIWKEQNIVVDGHNRYDICQQFNIPLKPPTAISFADKNTAKVWIINHQIGKRNLNDYQRSVMALKLEELLRPMAETHLHISPGRPNDEKGLPILAKVNPINTREQVAEVARVSHGTLDKVKVIEREATSEQKARLVSGNTSIHTIYNAVKKNPRADVPQLPDDPPAEYITISQWETFDIAKRSRIINPILNGSRPSFNSQENDNIEWAQWTWNPITGCKTGCKYCYARDIADRFYPQKFTPSFYPKRLLAPSNMTIPSGAKDNIGLKNVFACSMSDMFGPWVPAAWTDAILDSIKQSPGWNFLILTKWPENLAGRIYPANVWLGTTVDCQERVARAESTFRNIEATVKFVSCEPLSEPLQFGDIAIFDWVIIGGRSKTSSLPEFRPPRLWVNQLEAQALAAKCRIYEKPNLLERYKEYPNV